MGMVPTCDARSTASRYFSCSTLNTTIWRPQKTSRVYYRDMNRHRLYRIFAAALATAGTMTDDCLSIVSDYTKNKLQDIGHCSVSICTITN